MTKKENNNLECIFLAAGQSSRMWPLDEKIFFKYLNKTVLEHQFETLKKAGIYNFNIIGSEKNILKIKKIISGPLIKNCSVRFAIQKSSQKGIKGALLAAEKIINKNNPLFIVNSNDIVEKSIFEKVITESKKKDFSILMVGKNVEKYFPGGYLKINSKNEVLEIIEKPGQEKRPSNLVCLLLHVIKKSEQFFKILKQTFSKQDNAYEQVIQKFINQKETVKLLPYNGFWQPLKYPWDHLKLMNYFLSSLKKSFIHKSSFIGKNVVLDEPYYIDKNVKIFDFSVLKGPIFIGKNTTVGNHCLIRSSHIGKNCLIGKSSEITRSYLGENIRTHQNFIGDSILEKNISLGAGSKTGNLRLDEKEISSIIKNQKINSNLKKLGCIMGQNIRIGINSSLMPGIKIGNNSFLTAGICVEKDVENKTFLKGNYQLIKKENKVKIPILKNLF